MNYPQTKDFVVSLTENIMNNYTIYCTEEQTKKALELGAPIVHHENAYTTNSTPHFYIGEYGNYQKGCILYIIPTAEEMIGWLEEQGDIDVIRIDHNFKWDYCIWNKNLEKVTENYGCFNSRKEATLAAIDAAVDYLSNKK